MAVILPDTVTSARYVQFDAPYLTQALTAAGLSSSQFTVQNAQGSDATQLSDAQTAITKGATVLIMDPLDAGVGAQIETYAKAHGVAVIDYDRLTLGGSRQYYVSFNNVAGRHQDRPGLRACAAAWKVSKPNVLVMKGDPTDNNATLFAQGYLGVLNPFFSSGVRERPASRPAPGPVGRAERVPAELHRAQEHQLGPRPERRQRRADHPLPADQGRQGQDLPGHRAGRHH